LPNLIPSIADSNDHSTTTTKRCITRLIDQERAADHCDGYYESSWPIDRQNLH
jgi:hypothetical protein